MKKFVASLMLLFLVGCTEQQAARRFGGKTSVDLPPGQTLVIATWKDNSLWYLTRARKAGETPQTYTFKESSSFGVWEGVVAINEK